MIHPVLGGVIISGEIIDEKNSFTATKMHHRH
jgi:hypothetical protein